MMKRIIPLVLTMCLLVFYCVSSSSPVYASELTVQQANDLIAPLATINNFQVAAFVSTGNTSSAVGYDTVTSGYISYYNHAVASYYGFRVEVPPSDVGGYLCTFGVTPVAVSYSSGTPSWTRVAYSSASYMIPGASYYYLSVSSSFYPGIDTTELMGLGASYPGYCYIPAHDKAVYLFVYSSLHPYGVSVSGGALYYNVGNPVQFVPVSDYSSALSDISSYLPIISNGISSTNTYLNTINSNISSIKTSASSIDTKLTTTNSNLSTISTRVNTVNTNLTAIKSVLDSISASVSKPSSMEQFESDYLEKFGDQISKAEEALSSSNPALPNGGDIGGFVSDISEGLGLNGSSFSASDFSNALGGYSGSGSVSSGGPWEFFSQAVADSLSGDVASASDGDDDYIYQWYEQIKERFGNDRFGSVIE